MAQQTGVAANPDEGASCKCDKDTWPGVLFGLGFGANVLVCIVAVMDILGGNTAYIILDAYLFLFGVVGASAELRFYASVRGLMYYIVKHVYFIVKPKGKAIFYLFVASLTWSAEFKLLPWITAILMAVVAVILFGVDVVVGLPIYLDKEVAATLNSTATNIAVAHVKAEATGQGSAMGGGEGRI